MTWLDPAELRIGLGCMRLPADEQLALDTVAAAADAGVRVFDTAHAYAPDHAALGHNERVLARALESAERHQGARIITKGGMTRPGGRWVPDGRAKALAADCEASLEALGGLPIDLYLIHAPDPRTPWRTSVRELARLAEQGLVKRVGLANMTRTQLDEALELAPVAAVQVAVNPFDDRAVQGGVISRCAELGVTVIAHSPLGGPERAARLARRDDVARIAARHDATAAEATLAWLLGVSPVLVAIPGARRPMTARSAARAAALDLTDDDRAALSRAFGRAGPPPVRPTAAAPATAPARGEIVMVMGIPGAGKSRVAAGYVARGYLRLNRDDRGGSLRALAAQLDEQLVTGIRQAVLDNTYLTRASRSYVVETAIRHGLPLRCIWLETPLAQAQVNLIERLLERFGLLPAPEQVREATRREPWLMLPLSQMRALRELEPPSTDEGFIEVERVPFTRAPIAGGQPGVFIGAATVSQPGFGRALAETDPAAPHLVFDWVPAGDTASLDPAVARIAKAVAGPVDAAVCPHAGGPPSCWCRPPLPGLPLAFAHAHGVDPACSTLIGCSRAHLAVATTLGARYVGVS
jgi:aryl-alcohol dehydrogenase-like predicted oxidoreductase/adenylate kinase family enzyme